LLFIVGPIISLILFKKVAECDEKQWTLIRLRYHTTRMAGQLDWACKRSQCACALAVVDWPGNDNRLGIWTSAKVGTTSPRNGGRSVCIVR
jgi:hypothetical protein